MKRNAGTVAMDLFHCEIMQLSCLPCCYYRYEAKKHRQHKKLFSIPRRRLWREKRKARRISAAVKPKELWRTRTTRKFLCGELLSRRGWMNICALAMAKNDNDDDDDDENGVRYATSTNASAQKMDVEDDVIKFDPLEFIPHFSYAWVVLGFVLPGVVSSLPIVQEQDDGGVTLLYQTRLCSEVAKLAYLSYALGKRNFTLSIGNQPQNDVLSGAAFGIGTSLAARVAEQTLTPALVESNSSVVATSTPAVLAIVLSSTVLAPITEEIFSAVSCSSVVLTFYQTLMSKRIREQCFLSRRQMFSRLEYSPSLISIFRFRRCSICSFAELDLAWLFFHPNEEMSRCQ
jgi:hypothetical protein